MSSEKLDISKFFLSAAAKDKAPCERATKSRKSRHHSVTNYKEQKTLNVESEVDIFINISFAFEDAVSKLDIESDGNEQVLEILIKIQNLLKNKISELMSINTIEDDGTGSTSEARKLGSNSLLSSMLSLCSEVSNLEDDSSFKKFMINVYCPFCSQSQADKTSLIKHLDKSCKALIQKNFQEQNHIQFSVFQILPNGTFKCNICPNKVQKNLRNYFVHMQNQNHISGFAKASRTKNYSELLFCSCCKVQVFNTFTQIDFHIKHDVHKARSKSKPNIKTLLMKKIYFIYEKKKRLKCLQCQSYYKTPALILLHFCKNRFKNLPEVPNLNLIYCDFCFKEIPMTEIFEHLSSVEHKIREEKEVKEESFELCLYCGFLCKNLMELSLHMESKCSVINFIRKNNTESDKSGLIEYKKVQKKNKEESKSVEGGGIKVKGFAEIPELFEYFKKFGEISSMKICEDNNVMINFNEKSTVDVILSVGNQHTIDGFEIEVMTKRERNMNKSKEESYEQIIRENDEQNSSTSGSCEDSESDSTEEGDGNVNFNWTLQGDQLQSLFQRVSSHLMNSTLKLDLTNEGKEIASDFAEAIKLECDFVGFSKCDILFPVEKIGLYCEVGVELFGSNANIKKVLKDVLRKMGQSKLWEEAVICFNSPFPQIACIHQKTQKTCTVIFSSSAIILTDMLRNIMKKSDLVRPFCLLVRFWLAVHKLKIKDFEYGLISLLIYFLISQKVVEYPMNLSSMCSDIILLNNTVQEKLSLNPEPFKVLDVTELFHRFLLFISTFDFDKYSICVPLMYLVEKKFLLNTSVFSSSNGEILNSSMCVTDPLLRINLTSGINENDMKLFKKVVNRSLKNYHL